jgi:hypothetical protein
MGVGNVLLPIVFISGGTPNWWAHYGDIWNSSIPK